ncbi:NtaA/DmoA family FMN-dependent monooxygenase [Herbiconiux moechotypicola]|uniref:LLM class flavin-dependent oxidoreductase n=1 Tax=Herbiconiux moechotypicola TaxID=637393 RepID=A0ABP5Q6R9_9MICO|nr:NtaA/DmoA family FMN-dependent monooxygenase [Herbiconiux moechotypicola]MCS5728185.1 NtaA/DmoA family FMN-dependent monooxygenase [Herbiconiux moechotypicola]
MPERRPLLYGLYEQACVGNGSGAVSLWTHPSDERLNATGLQYWLDLARRTEEAGFDLFFFGDVLGLYDTYGGSAATALEWGVEIPAHDPLLHIPALAAVTEHLAFGATVSTTYEHPFAHARRFSTLDHLTAGRVAWNVVTSYLPGAARNFGLDVVAHDTRYDRADEFLDVAYGLWEGSWEDGAYLGSKERRRFADPSKVHRIDHDGAQFQVAGPHLSIPSPQRTPVIVQAGWSARGREFAARHAELVFVGESEPAKIREGLDDIRRRAAEFGRDPSEIRAVVGLNPVLASTPIAVQEKIDDLQSYYSAEAQLAAYAGWSGIDFTRYRDDEPLVKQETNHTQIAGARPDTPPLPAGEVRERFSRVTAFADDRFIGTPDAVAAEVERFVDESGVDGFLLHQFVSPGSLNDFTELLVPRLRERGLFGGFPTGGTFRSRLRSDRSDRLAADHPAARWRRGGNENAPNA